MNLTELENMDCFVDTKPVRKEVQWKTRGGVIHKATVFVVRQSFGAIETAVLKPEEGQSSGAILIARSLRFGEDASEQLTYEQAFSLRPELAWAFVAAINEVNAPKP